MGRDTHIDELLSRHEAAGTGGHPLSPEELCRDCPELLDELKRRLANLQSMNNLLASGEERTQPAREQRESASAAELPRIEGYEILGELGRGGMGVVYQVRQTRLYNRMAALKMICAGTCASPGERARFLTEAELAARLQHPHIVQVYELGEHNGQPYLVLEFVEGDSLARKLAGTPLLARQAAQLVETLARAMHYAHGRGVIHRDLKPANVLLAADGTPKITDFGLAKLTIGGDGRTISGDIIGTPCYMAPEQAAGQVGWMGPATDVYALGAILYEMLTGRPPFRGTTTVETLQQVQHLDPVPPRWLQPQVSRDLETICLKCLEKEPLRRYTTAADLADDLRRFLDGESIRARPAGRAERAVKWARRHPTLTVLLAAGFALLLGLIGYTVQRQHDYELIKSERDRAQKAEGLARQREVEAQAARYASRTRLASQVFNAGDVFQLPGLLDPFEKLDGPAGDCRGFAWWYLRQYRQEAKPTLAAHEGPVHFLAYSADGRWLITAGNGGDREALVVRTRDGGTPRWHRGLRDIGSPSDHWVPVAHAPGTAMLAGISSKQKISLWDAGTGAEQPSLTHVDAFRIALSPDGHWLAAGGDEPVTVWDTTTKQKRTLAAAVGPLAFSPDGQTLVVGGDTDAFRGLQWWDRETGKKLAEFRTEAGVGALTCSPSGAYLIVWLRCGWGEIWDMKERVPLHWPQLRGNVSRLAISPDDQVVAAGYDDGQVRLWDFHTRRLRARYRCQANPIVRMAFSPDGRSLAAANSEDQVYQVDATASTVPDRLQGNLVAASSLPVWSPDGRTVAIRQFNGPIRLVDVQTGRVRVSLANVAPNTAHTMASSPDGKTFAAFAFWERSVRLWDAATGRLLGTTAAHGPTLNTLAFSPDGRRLAVADTTMVRLWDVSTLSDCGVLLKGSFSQVAFTPDGRFLVTTGQDRLQVWDLSRSEPPRQPCSSAPLEPGVSRLAIAPDGRRIAGGCEGALVEFWQLSRDGQLTRELPPRQFGGRPGSHRVFALQFGPEGATLLTSVEGGSADLWDVPSGRHRVWVGGHLEFSSLSPDGNTLAAICPDGGLHFWDMRTWRVTRPPGQLLWPITSLGFTPDGTLVTGSRTPGRLIRGEDWGIRYQAAPLNDPAECVRYWNTATGREIIPSGLPSGETMAPPNIMACSLDGSTVAAGGEDGAVWVWDRAQGKQLARLFLSDAARDFARIFEAARALTPRCKPDYAARSEHVQALAFSPDGRWLAASGNHGSVRLLRTGDWEKPRPLSCERVSVPWIAFTTDSSRLAVAQGGVVRLWDVETGEAGAAFGEPGDAPVLCGAFAPDRRLLATGSRDHIIRLWNLDTGTLRARLVGHMDRVTALAFTPDGKTLASGSWDRSVRLWSVAVAEEVALLEGHASKVHALVFSPDGQTLASGSGAGDNGEVLLWRAKRP